MINSMTGYGSSEGRLKDFGFTVEIRAVNNRYLKTRIKLPESITFLEDEIDKLLAKNLCRGTINYTLRLKEASSSALFNVDQTALRSLAEQLGKISSSADINFQVDVASLLALPGILIPVVPTNEQAERIKVEVLRVSQAAIDKLKQMRIAEGKILAADLDVNCSAIESCLEQIRTRVDVVLAEYADKLGKRVGELLAGAGVQLDQELVAREVAIFAERSDVSEELSRLSSHLQQFAAARQSDGSGGRRLDFLTQEMLREANTIASKASNAEIIHWVVDVKCHIDRIKEQVQNIE